MVRLTRLTRLTRLAQPRHRVELGGLLSRTVRDVIAAQNELDADARQRLADAAAAQDESLALPPLWFTFTDVDIDLELETSIEERRGAPAQAANNDTPPRPGLLVRPLDPAAPSLYGRRTSAGLRVRLRLGPATERGTTGA